MRSKRRVLLGRIVGVYSVHGAVKIESFTEPRLAIFNYGPWLLEGKFQTGGEIARAHGYAHAKGIVAMLPGVEGRDAAAAWVGAKIWISRETLPKPGSGEMYQTDLEGLQVLNSAGEDLGCVSHLFDNGAHHVLVACDETGRQRLIPYVVGRYVKSVDLDARRITVDWHKDD